MTNSFSSAKLNQDMLWVIKTEIKEMNEFAQGAVTGVERQNHRPLGDRIGVCVVGGMCGVCEGCGGTGKQIYDGFCLTIKSSQLVVQTLK